MATIKKRGNSYLFVVSLGYDANGKQKTTSRTWRIPPNMRESTAQREANRLAVLFEEEVRTQGATERKKFSDFCELWFQRKSEKGRSEKTLQGYNDLLVRIMPEFGHLYMDKITGEHLENFYSKLRTIEKPISF